MTRATAPLLALALTLGAVAPSFAAEESALQFPAQDGAIVEHLPTHVGDAAERRAARAAERAQRTALQQHPDELGLALQAAHDALARGRLRGDPRELGVAQAALAPWWGRADAPPEVRLVQATTLQSQHFFKDALVELDAVLATPGVSLPVRAQAELTRAGVQQVLGHFADADAGCRRLAGADYFALGSGVRLNALACIAELSSLQGHADTAASTLARLAGAPDASSAATVAGDAAPGWLNLMRAELAQRRGDPAAGALFAAALKANADVYTQCAYADWLLDQHRPAEVLALLKGNEAADPVLLRVALAYKQSRGRADPLTRGATAMLGERYDAALLRGDKSHGREQSRYELELRGDARAALGYARTNWAVQHEPADEVVLARAAHASHRDDAAAPLWQFLRDTGGRDVRLAVGGPAAAPFLPATNQTVSPERAMNRACLVALLAAIAPFAQAHKASDAYVTLHVDGATVDARIDIALRDLDRDLDLDANADDQLSWKEVRTRWADIAALARTDIRLSADGVRCTPDPASTPATDANAPALTAHSDGSYAVLRTQWHCAAPVQALSVEYELFAKTDPTHRGIARVARAEAGAGAPAPQLAVLSPGNGWHRFRLPPLPAPPAAASASADFVETPAPAPPAAVARQAPADANADGAAADDTPASSFLGFVREGVHHILIGYDHILFLLSLLLPAVWIRSAVTDPRTGVTRTRWVPSDNLRLALTNVLKVVTAFTVAHSITLALSVLNVVNPPSRWVESIIAASVVLAALNNIWPLISEARWKLTFVFGLVHGFGFASALKDAGLAKGALVGPLVGFNVGVEIGQLCIVAVVLPIAWSLRGTRTYRGAFAGGSLAIAAVAGLWLVQRVFDLSLIAG